jgi:hypothetical protein
MYMATDMHATIEEPLEAMFYMRPVLSKDEEEVA